MPLELKPTRIGKSLYLLIPKPLKELFETRDDSRFIMVFEANGESYKLVYLPDNREVRNRLKGTKAQLK